MRTPPTHRRPSARRPLADSSLAGRSFAGWPFAERLAGLRAGPRRHAGLRATLLGALLGALLAALPACNDAAATAGGEAASSASASTDGESGDGTDAGESAAARTAAATAEIPRPAGGKPGKQTKVVVEPLRIGPVRDEIVVSAKVAARTTVVVHSKLANLAAVEVLVEAGDEVEQGQVLVALYDDDLQLAAQTAAAVLDETRRTVERSRLTLEEESRRVDRAEREAQRAAEDFARLVGLGDLVNRQEVDNARVTSENARDDLELARFTGRSSAIALELAEIAVRKAEIEAERARNDLGHTRIRSPIRGVVAERTIQAGEMVGTSAPLLRLVDTADLVLNLRVPQDALSRLARGQPVEVRSVTDAKQRFEGVVRTVNPVLDQATGTVHVVVDMQAAPGLVPGLFAEAHIITASRPEALLVNKRAVLYEDDQPVLFAVDAGGSARKIAFRAGAGTPVAVEILSGLDGEPLPSDLRVIVVGQENLKDGAAVQVVEEAF